MWCKLVVPEKSGSRLTPDSPFLTTRVGLFLDLCFNMPLKSVSLISSQAEVLWSCIMKEEAGKTAAGRINDVA